MFVLGITGGIGAGKTAVADYLAGRGVRVVDADIAARQVVEPGEPALRAIADYFGEDILGPDGQLDRPALRQRIFASDQDRRWLENLLHPLINVRLQEQLHKAHSPYAALVSPLLFETGQHKLVDRVLVVDVPESLQIARAMQRDGQSKEQILAIMRTQLDRQERLRRADDRVDNSTDLAGLHAQLKALHHSYMALAAFRAPVSTHR